MERKYDQSLYLMNLSEIKPSFSKHVIKRLKEFGINTLGELFDLYDDNKRLNSIYPKKGSSNSIYELIGTTRLLRYKYLKEDLELDKKSGYLDFGFSGRAINIIMLNGWKLGRNLSNYERILKSDNSRFLNSDGIGELVKEEIINKCSILREYNEEKKIIDGNNSKDEISILTRKLNLLEKKKELLNMQIQELTDEIERLKTKTL